MGGPAPGKLLVGPECVRFPMKLPAALTDGNGPRAAGAAANPVAQIKRSVVDKEQMH